ncbi:TIGR02453 family protein [Bacteroidia bacterium]|nr:TIGR02453 family protein [Bacteroidia bacterium]
MSNKTQPFTGFSPETFQFFRDLYDNNHKPWFDANKKVYETQVLEPLKALALALSPFFYAMDAGMLLNPAKMVSRIYRDIRFSKDKTPYKEHMWISFQRPFPHSDDSAWATFPGFYLEIGKAGISFGMGMFNAGAKTMTEYREAIQFAPEHFKQITKDLLGKHKFEMGGDAYKRPIPNELEAYFQPWIQRKGLWLHKSLPIGKTFYSNELVAQLEAQIAPLNPLYDFLTDICE